MMELRGVSAGYGGKTVLEDVSIRFPAGAITGIIGPNGGGKSTILRVLARLLRPDRGEVLLDGENARALPRKAYARQVAYMPQNRDTPVIRVSSFVLHGRFPHQRYPRVASDRDRAVVLRAMRMAHVDALGERMMHTLSGGERQRVYTAMLLAQDTRAVLLDEPGTHLDIRYRMELSRTMQALKAEGKAVIAVLHDLDEAMRLSDRIVVVAGGRVLSCNDPDSPETDKAVKAAFGVHAHRFSDARGATRYYYTDE